MNGNTIRRSLLLWGILWLCAGGGVALADEPKLGGTLRIGQVGGILNFDGHRLPFGNYPLLPQIYNTLVRNDDKLKPQPELAESWTFSPDEMTLEFKLREGVKFHNGRELVADDVVWNIQRVQDPKEAAQIRPLSLAIKSAEAVAKYRVVLHLEKPTPGIMDLFDSMYIMPKEAAATIEKMGVGTGSFQVVQWIPGDRVILKKFPDYFRKGLPYLDGVILQQIPDAPALAVNLEAGALEAAYNVSPRDADRLKKDGKAVVRQAIGGGVVFDIMMNVSKAPFDNKKVRQAIAHAVDRKRFVDTVLMGFVEPWCQPFPPQSLGFSKDLGTEPCRFDLGLSKQLLAEAGHPNGFESVLTISTANFPSTRALAQILQSDLAKIGVRLTIRDVEPAAYREATWGTQNKFAIVLHEYGPITGDPDRLRAVGAYFPKGMTTFTAPEYVRLLEQAGGTMDAAKRRPVYDQLARYLADEVFTVPIAPDPTLLAVRSTVHGVDMNVTAMPLLEKAWLAH